MTTTNAVFRSKNTTETIDDSAPVVAGDTYPALQSVIVDTSATGDYVDKDGRTAANSAAVSVRIPNGDANAVISAGAEITVAEFALVEIVTGASLSGPAAEVELISRSGSNNPGNGNPFQHSDAHGSKGTITYAAGIYTIGVGGLYDIDASLTLANGTSAGNVSAQVFINGVAEGPIALISNDGVANFPGSGAVMIARTLAAGDTVEFRQLTTPGFNVNKSTSMRIATRGGPRGADGVDGTDGASGTPGTDGVDGAPGLDGTNGADGQSIDHITLTAGTSAPGTTDTYTAWGDAGETINLGTFDVPIPAAMPISAMSRSGNNNPGTGNPFQHSEEHLNIGNITYASGVYTIGTQGVYSIDYGMQQIGSNNVGFVAAGLFINGVQQGAGIGLVNDSANNWPIGGSSQISLSLSIGDTVEIRQTSTPGFGGTNKVTSINIVQIQ